MARRLEPSDLLEAAYSGDVEKVLKLLDVSHNDQSDSVDSRSAGLNVTDVWGKTALHLAVREKSWRKGARTKRAISTLVHAGADINFQSYSRDKRTPLMLAISARNLSSVRKLLELGADINCVDGVGRNALMLAAERGDYDCLKCLIKFGADVNVQSRQCHSCNEDFGKTALMFAARKAAIKCLKLLVKRGADVNVKTSQGETVLHMAASCLPVSTNVIKCMKILIDSGADWNPTTLNGETPLMQVTRFGFETNKNLEDKLVKVLTTSGIDVNRGNREGLTLLMLASVNLMPILIKAGANLDQQDSNGMTALDHAVKSGRNKCISLLVDSGADVTKIDSKGQTALMHAIMGDFYSSVPPILTTASVAVINHQDSNGMTALTLAVSVRKRYREYTSNVEWLVKNGASVNICDHSHKTPLHYLLMNRPTRSRTLYLEILLRECADVNATDKDGMTPLMYAAQCCWDKFSNREVLSNLSMLLEHKANVNAMDNLGQTALIHHVFSYYYYCSKDSQSIRLLLDHGAKPTVGRLAKGKISNVAFLHFDLDLIGLEVGDEVDLEVQRDHLNSVTRKDFRRILLFLISNQVMLEHPPSVTKNPTMKSLLDLAVRQDNLGIVKYLLAVCYMQSTDLTFALARSLGQPIKSNSSDVVTVIDNLRSQPLPLVKLCFVVVSTAFGASPGRQERVKNSQLPVKVQKMLLFQESWSRLCVHQWDRIPLTFNWDEYEKLPRPRPLLYHWPVGRALVPCDCGKCDGTLYKYELEEEENENGED